MAFRFPLASVLRFREIHEQREERLLIQILAQVAQSREALSALDRQIAEAAVQRERELQGRLSAAALLVAYGLAAMLKERRLFTEQQLAQFEALRDKQIEVYRSAHQDRELLSTMRQEQRESFAIEQNRLQQKSLDDMYMARRMYQ